MRNIKESLRFPSGRILLYLLILGVISPFIALIIMPRHYSFYMFYPATLKESFDKVRFWLGNSILVGGFILSCWAVLGIMISAIRRRKYLLLLTPIIILLHPLQQPIFLESLDNYLNWQIGRQAQQLNLIGKSPAEIRKLLGNPHFEWTETPRMLDRDGNTTMEGETYTAWEYQPIRFYWLGSRFQVFFTKGIVSSFEANDD